MNFLKRFLKYLKRNWLVIPVITLAIFAMPLIGEAQSIAPDYVFGGVALDKEVDQNATAFPFAGFAYELPGERTLSFTSMDFSPVDIQEGINNTLLGSSFQITVRTGFAYDLIDIKKLSLYSLADVGLVNAEGKTTSSVGWGGFVHYEVNKWLGAMVLLQAERSPYFGTNLKPRFGLSFDLNALQGD
jgi:hypothetical protein